MILSFRSLIAIALISASGLSGCSNPFSGHTTQPVDTFHTKNVACDQIDLSASTVSAPLVRSIVRCLNTHQEIDAANSLIEGMSDEELAPLVQWLDQKGSNSPQTLYAIKELILRMEKDGRFTSALQEINLLIKDPESNHNMAKILAKLDEPVESLLNGSGSLEIEGKSAYVLTSSKAYLRLFQQHQDSAFLKTFISKLKNYLNEKDADSLEDLFSMLSSNHVDAAFRALTEDQGEVKIQKLSHFFSWLFTSGRYPTLTSSVRAIQNTQSLNCMEGAVHIKEPLSTGLKQLSTLTPDQARVYLNHDLYNMALLAKGYCEVPYSIDPLMHFIRDAAEQPGFDEMFTLIRPLLNDDRFITFIGSHASENWVASNSNLAQGNFFEDLFTLVKLDLDFPLTNDGAKVAHLLDQSFQQLTPDESFQILQYLGPWFTLEHGYGTTITKLWFQIQSEVSSEFDSPVYAKEKIRANLVGLDFKPFIRNTLKSPKLGAVLDLAHTLIEKNKLQPLINETFQFFKTFLNRGAHTLTYLKAVMPQFPPNHPYFWQLTHYQSNTLEMVEERSSGCAISLDWSFTNYPEHASTSDQKVYQAQMDSILACLNPNQTFKNAYDFYTYSVHSGDYSYLVDLQKDFFADAFSISQSLTLDSIKTFLKMSPQEMTGMPQLLHSGSQILGIVNQLHPELPRTKAWLSRELKKPDLYQGIAELTSKNQSPPNEHAPALDLIHLSKIDAIVSREQSLAAVTFEAALAAFFEEYCPTRDSADSSCGLEPDQLQLYLKSPAQLALSIKNEYLNSTQNSYHSNEFKHWSGPSDQPETVSDVSYHLNPLYQLFYSRPQMMKGAFNVMRDLKTDHLDLGKFMQSRAVKLTLIPYYYENPNYPAVKGKQFRDFIRIRLVSELDRLELIAINADFKALGLLKNFGLGFIRDIGLSWGDEPQSRWPSDLSKFVNLNKVKTLSETSEAIHQQLSKFDGSLIQSLGSCDPRGRSKIGSWIANHLCNAEISDISARLFNLRSLVSLLDRELPAKDGGQGGLLLLRDMFYNLYAQNSDATLGNFPNGMKLPDACLLNPLAQKNNFTEENGAAPNTQSAADITSDGAQDSTNEPAGDVTDTTAANNCAFDNLTLIPRITHLGLLHQVGMSYLRDSSSPILETVSIANRVIEDPKLEARIIDLFSKRDSLAFLQDAIHLGFSSSRKLSGSISPALSVASHLQGVQWFNFMLDLLEKDPHILQAYSPLVERVLEQSADPLETLRDKMNQNGKLTAWAETALDGYDPKLAGEISPLLTGLKKSLPELSKIWDEMATQDKPDLNALRPDAVQWFTLLGTDDQAPKRAKLSQWVNGGGAKEFCDVFSDSQLMDKTYSFLESINQNSDSTEFINRCEDFLIRP
jgi:hypothetical protein